MNRRRSIGAWFVGVWNWVCMFAPSQRIRLLKQAYQNGMDMGRAIGRNELAMTIVAMPRDKRREFIRALVKEVKPHA